MGYRAPDAASNISPSSWIPLNLSQARHNFVPELIAQAGFFRVVVGDNSLHISFGGSKKAGRHL